MILDYVALVILVLVVLILFYGIIVIHDIPYELAKKRNHPHSDAIHYAGWVSLFTLHALWPFLWIWATLWRDDRGWGIKKMEEGQQDIHNSLTKLYARIDMLKTEIDDLKKGHHGAVVAEKEKN